MSTTMVGQRRKILELHWIKRPKTVLRKTKFGPENKWFKTSENKWFKTSYLDFINFRFSGRKSQSQQKLAKKITHFEIQFRSKNLTHFRDLNSFNIIKIKSCNTVKHLTLHIFQRTCFWLVSEKHHLHCTFSRRPITTLLKHLQSNCLDIPVNLRKKILFQRCRKFLSVGGLNSFLKAVCCLSPSKCFKFFMLTEFFWNSTIF